MRNEKLIVAGSLGGVDRAVATCARCVTDGLPIRPTSVTGRNDRCFAKTVRLNDSRDNNAR